MREVIAARARGEQGLRDSGAPYVIVRPGWLTDARARGARLAQGDVEDGQVSRDTVADACVGALLTPAAHGRTFELFDDDAGTADVIDWERLLGELAPDPEAARAR